MIGASTPILMSDDAGGRASARSRIAASVPSVGSDALDTKVMLEIGDGRTLVCTITRGRAGLPCRKIGASVCGPIRASRVIVGASA